VVLFELLTNQVPFAGETLPVACVKVLCDEPVSLRAMRPDVPAEIETVIRRCLQKHPEERFPSVLELSESLAPFASPECAESLRRVRRILGEPAPARAPFRTLSGARDSVNDSTPVPSARTTSGLTPALRPRRLWPAALVVAATASLAILTQSDPRALQQMSVIAGQRLHGAARAGVRAAAGAAERAVDWASSQSLDVRVNASLPAEGVPATPRVVSQPKVQAPAASASSLPGAATRRD
jgi:serine/threonine-protein kinase